jgi:hypothetical protein
MRFQDFIEIMISYFIFYSAYEIDPTRINVRAFKKKSTFINTS